MSASPDVQRAFTALSAKQGRSALLWRYYDGDQPLQYATRRLASVFRDFKVRWTENWCAVVVDSLLDRLSLGGFSLTDSAAAAALDGMWNTLDLALDADRIHKAVAVCGEGFLVVGSDAAGRPQPYANRPHLVHAFYREDAPKTMEMAAKWWESGGAVHLTLYYADRLEHYVAKGTRRDVKTAGAFAPDPDAPEEVNESGVIPVFHFCPDHESVAGELTNVIPLQDAKNKLLADMMVAAEYGAFRQRWVISSASSSDLKNGPNEVWEVAAGDGDGQDTAVGEFGVTDLRNFLDAMDNLAAKIAVISRTPKHYLLMQGGDPSGEALAAMEAPLQKKVSRYQKRLAVTWDQAAVFLLGALGHEVQAVDVDCLWGDERTVQPRTEADVRLTNVKAGIPLTTQLRRDGWSEEELAQLDADRQAEDLAAATLGDAVLDEARRRFDQGRSGAPYEGVTS